MGFKPVEVFFVVVTYTCRRGESCLSALILDGNMWSTFIIKNCRLYCPACCEIVQQKIDALVRTNMVRRSNPSHGTPPSQPVEVFIGASPRAMGDLIEEATSRHRK
jgi:hypothetical protein